MIWGYHYISLFSEHIHSPWNEQFAPENGWVSKLGISKLPAGLFSKAFAVSRREGVQQLQSVAFPQKKNPVTSGSPTSHWLPASEVKHLHLCHLDFRLFFGGKGWPGGWVSGGAKTRHLEALNCLMPWGNFFWFPNYFFEGEVEGFKFFRGYVCFVCFGGGLEVGSQIFGGIARIGVVGGYPLLQA